MKPVLLTNSLTNEKAMVNDEPSALKAGFEIVPWEVKLFFDDQKKPDKRLDNRKVFVRHHANEDGFLRGYLERQNCTLLVPNYWVANEWYKIVPNDYYAAYWLKRSVNWVDLRNLEAENLEWEEFKKGLSRAVNGIFGMKDKMFIKSKTKHSIGSGIYTKADAIEVLTDQLAMYAHIRLSEVIYSEPVEIDHAVTEYGRAEYRCFIVDGNCVSVSYFSDTKYAPRIYKKPKAFADEFAKAFEDRLPLAYCLDIARLKDGSMAVIECNDIAASGNYADNNSDILFSEIYKLGEPYAQNSL